MRKVKMFDFYADEIFDALEEANFIDDFMDTEVISNDTAISWYIFTKKDKEEYNYDDYRAPIDKVLLEAGCVPGENVFIWISW